MKIVLIVSLIVASIAVRSVQAAESIPGSALPQTQRVILKWLGTAGWEMSAIWSAWLWPAKEAFVEGGTYLH